MCGLQSRSKPSTFSSKETKQRLQKDVSELRCPRNRRVKRVNLGGLDRWEGRMSNYGLDKEDFGAVFSSAVFVITSERTMKSGLWGIAPLGRYKRSKERVINVAR